VVTSYERRGFPLDEIPLREWILRAYHEKRRESERSRLVIDAVRQFLSGPPGGETVPGLYWFEEQPEGSVTSFRQDLERVAPWLAELVFRPIIAGVRERASSLEEPFPNPAVSVASLAGSVAVKGDLDETVACAVVAAAVIGVARLGCGVFEDALAARPRTGLPGRDPVRPQLPAARARMPWRTAERSTSSTPSVSATLKMRSSR
jgi:hypothetical protein